MAVKKKKTKKANNIREKIRQKALAKLERLADEEALEIYQSKTLPKYSSKTLTKFIDAVGKDGFGDDIMTMKMSELASMMAPAQEAKKGRKKAITTDGGRLSKKDMEKAQKTILGFLKSNPWSPRKAIAKHMGTETKRLFSPMKKLTSSGQVISVGQKAGKRYALKGAKKPK